MIGIEEIFLLQILLQSFILDAPHEAYFNNNLLISHPFGLQSDASQYLKNIRKEYSFEISTFTFSYKSGGGTVESHITDNDCVNYVKENFWNGKSDKPNVIIPHLEQLDQKSLNYQMAIQIHELLSSSHNLFFTEVNLFQLLLKIGQIDNELKTKFEGHLKNLPNLLVLYPDGYPAVILITLPDGPQETIHELFLKADANVKAYQSVHHHRMIRNKSFAIINIVAAVYHEESKLSSYCGSCKADLFITKEDFDKELQSWWIRLQKWMKKLRKNYRMNYDVEFTHETASLLAILNSVTDDRFPSLFASEDERINKIVLNEIQRSILLNPVQRKIIVGK